MVFVADVGTAASMPGDVSPAIGAPSTFSAGPLWNATPFLLVTANGVPLANVLGASVAIGLDIAVATATVELTDKPSIPNDSEIVITTGTGPNNVQRFRGLLKRTRSNLWPHTFTLICRGMLSRADRYRQSVGAATPSFINQRLPIVGLSLFDLVRSNLATDQNYVIAVLSRVPGLVVDPADIGGTGHVFGTLAWRELTWPPYVSALSQCQKLDEVCLGFRLFESLNGRIMRTQVYGYPTNISDTTFTEGIDVLSATGDRSIEELINAEYIEGYALGGKPGLISSYSAEGNDFQTADQPFIDQFSSPLIEDSAFAAQVRDWRLTERNRELVEIPFVTFRDDILVPGHTVAINLPHANVTEPVWLQHVDITVRARPASFRQTCRALGGGLPGTYTPNIIY